MLIPPRLLPTWQRWMARRHPNAGTEFVLRQNRIYVLPSGFGFAYGATAILVLVGAINYQLSLAYLFAFLMLGLGHSGLIQAFRNLLGLKIQVEAPRAVFVGQTAWFPLRLSVSNKLDRHALVLTAHRSLPGNPVGVAVGGEEVIGVGVPAQHRGWLSLPRVTLETAYPSGWCRAWSYASLEARCLVYPHPETDPPPWTGAPDNNEQGQINSKGDDEYAGLRPYVAGDTPRHIAWKQSARQENLAVRTFETPWTITRHFKWDQVALNNAEARLSRLAAWILQAEAAGERYALTLPGADIEAGHGPLHEARCLTALALFGHDDAEPAR
ncbi:DUF58 domain-containing protein [Amantichitinum ursilacus]|uniref:Uncharacterized protein n=1 Tax=Amantichitinum ursilacus TaxID=857265 RepID=A0A0N0XL04_9NEIS|nr:DUF58 domain-containing protein [Amantichitinum ursilacus]KPC55134.1 hypothetical protein WG78_00705 [Amantichitinum ursilacus]